MSWNNNEGPWGSQGNKNTDNPWTRKDTGGYQPPNMPPPPDLDKFFKYINDLLKKWHMGHTAPQQFTALGLVLLLAIWIFSGFYQVATDQVGVVMRFGAFDHEDGAGLHYHLPYPIEEVLLPNVTSQNEIQIGFRRSNRNSDDLRSIPEESMMLTQDENIINVEFAVFWRVSDINNFLFEIRDPEMTIKMGAESAMREVIGQNKLQFELTDGREQIAEEAKIRLQKLMDDYHAGVIITQINLQTVSVPDDVKAAFQDVVNARLDQQRFQNEAETHANKVIPEAKGEASKIQQQALAYRDQKIAIAQGEADRFKEVLAAYSAAKEVTARRLYLETMEAILSNVHKVIIDKAGVNTVPYLPLQELLNKKPSSEGANR